MSENLNRDFSKYEAMSTEELEEILRLDAAAPEGAQSDTELLFYVMEVLAKRKQNNHITGNTAQKAWESFQQYYMPEESKKSVVRKKPALWVRRMTAVAAIAALLILVPLTSSALTLGEAWEIIAQWAKETFSFVSEGNAQVSEPMEADQREFSSLQEMLQENNRDASLVPTWIPDGFVVDEIKKDPTPIQEVYSVRYKKGDKKLIIQVRTYLSSDIQNNEIESEPIDIYSRSGIDFYIFENLNQLRTIWIVDSYECIITGDVTIDELKLMIDSIQKGLK
jgi:hypothetical protein